MMVPRVRPAALLLLSLIVASACGGTEPGQEVETPLQCANGNNCTLPLPEAARFEVTLTSTSCEAGGNEVKITKPLVQTLTTNACYETVGTKWSFDGPYPAGTVLDFTIVSKIIGGTPALRASGSYPTWTITFEDGADTDFNDIVLSVKAYPTP